MVVDAYDVINELEEQMNEKIASGYGSLVEDINDFLGRINSSIIQHAENLECSLKSHVIKLKQNFYTTTPTTKDMSKAVEETQNVAYDEEADLLLGNDANDYVKKEIEKDYSYNNTSDNINSNFASYYDPTIEPPNSLVVSTYEQSFESQQPLGINNNADFPVSHNTSMDKNTLQPDPYDVRLEIPLLNKKETGKLVTLNQPPKLNNVVNSSVEKEIGNHNVYDKMDSNNNKGFEGCAMPSYEKTPSNYTPSHDTSNNPFSANGRSMGNLNTKIKMQYSQTSVYISPYTNRSGYPNSGSKPPGFSGRPSLMSQPSNKVMASSSSKDPKIPKEQGNQQQQYVNYTHHNQKNADNKKLQCDECGYATDKNAHMREHVDAVHNKIRPFSCGKCGHSFHRQFNLNIHEFSCRKVN